MCNFIGWDICDTDCISWGNYGNAKGNTYTGLHSNDGKSDWVKSTSVTKLENYTNKWIFPTGKFVHSGNTTPDTVKKNIYDVAGNVWEWTTEIPRSNILNSIIRGGSTYDDGSFNIATVRNGSDPSDTLSYFHIGFRIVLYVK